MATKPETTKAVTPLGPNGLGLAETVRNVYRISPPAGSTPADALDPAFWVHVARLLRLGDKVEIMADDWYAEATVLEVGSRALGGVRVAFTHGPVDLVNDVALPDQELFEPKWGGPNGGWMVVRKADGEVVKKNLPGKEAVARWIDSHMKAMAA